MQLSTRRKIYYTSVAAALVAILVSAVVINRTLVNTPEFDIESISESAGEPVTAYMAYVRTDGKLAVGISEEGDERTAEIIKFVNDHMFIDSIVPEEEAATAKTADAWVILYDSENRIASRLNYYDGGSVGWYNGKRFESRAEEMQQLMEYCDESIAAAEETENEPVEPEADQGKESEEE